MNLIASSKNVTAANTNKEGTGTPNFIVTAQATDIYIDRVEFRAAGSNVATVARLFVNNGDDNADASNNHPVGAEEALAATTLDEAAAFAAESVSLGIWLPAGHRLFFVLGTAVAAGWKATAICGRYQDLQSFQQT